MFGRRDGDLNPRRFWSWFAQEAQGLANGIEALMRGETDAEWLMIGLNERIRRYDPLMEADLARTADGRCQLTVLGPDQGHVDDLIAAAPSLPGWVFMPPPRTPMSQRDARRVPFRLAPAPSLDAFPRIEAHHEAYSA